MMNKLNKTIDGMRRLNKRLVFDVSKLTEASKAKEEKYDQD